MTKKPRHLDRRRRRRGYDMPSRARCVDCSLDGRCPRHAPGWHRRPMLVWGKPLVMPAWLDQP